MKAEKREQHHGKRNFSAIAEPSGDTGEGCRNSLSFVIQKHAASRLHYDFRLEHNGVLLSWAVPNGPSLFPGDRRLAVRTEDHSLDYREFEGVIAANHYGAGPVMIWDFGQWEPLNANVTNAMDKGNLHFRLRGARLHGEWILAKMKRKKQRGEDWLLIKGKDHYALDKPDANYLKNTDFSAKSRRSFNEIAAGKQ